jgi:hypothetical protein
MTSLRSAASMLRRAAQVRDRRAQPFLGNYKMLDPTTEKPYGGAVTVTHEQKSRDDPDTNPHCPDATYDLVSYVGGEEVAVSCPSQIKLLDQNDEPEQCTCYTSVTLNPTVNVTVAGGGCTIHSLRVALATNCIEDGD